MSGRVLLVGAVVLAVLVTGCGSGAGASGPAAGETVLATASPTATPPAPAAKAGKAKKRAPSAAPSVAPEVVVPTTSDAVAQRSENTSGSTTWRTTVMTQFRRIDPRLVSDEAEVLRKVRATCDEMSTGLFETKVVAIIMKRFSRPKLTVTEPMAHEIYAVLLQNACYTMSSP